MKYEQFITSFLFFPHFSRWPTFHLLVQSKNLEVTHVSLLFFPSFPYALIPHLSPPQMAVYMFTHTAIVTSSSALSPLLWTVRITASLLYSLIFLSFHQFPYCRLYLLNTCIISYHFLAELFLRLSIAWIIKSSHFTIIKKSQII